MMSADSSLCLNVSFQCLGKICTKPVFLTPACHSLAEMPGLAASFQLAEGKLTADRDHTWKGLFSCSSVTDSQGWKEWKLAG